MNTLIAKVAHISFHRNTVRSFETIIEEVRVVVQFNAQEMTINLSSCNSIKAVKRLFFDILSLLHLYLGGFPQIDSLVINNQIKKLETLEGKYVANERFCRGFSSLCEIDETDINTTIIRNLRQLKQAPINSLQYLVSKGYDRIIVDHSITLLLHAIEGLISEDKLKASKEEMKIKYNLPKKSGDITAISYYLSKNYFFKYHRKFNCEILPLLGETQYSFIKTIADTRNWNSHFQNTDNQPNRLINGRDMIIYFYILIYATRILIMDLLGVAYDETQIVEYYYIVHDWIQEIMGKTQNPPKSAIYRNRENFEEAMKRIHHNINEETFN